MVFFSNILAFQRMSKDSLVAEKILSLRGSPVAPGGGRQLGRAGSGRRDRNGDAGWIAAIGGAGTATAAADEGNGEGGRRPDKSQHEGKTGEEVVAAQELAKGDDKGGKNEKLER